MKIWDAYFDVDPWSCCMVMFTKEYNKSLNIEQIFSNDDNLDQAELGLHRRWVRSMWRAFCDIIYTGQHCKGQWRE
jgi:hypothetical protein